MKPRTEFILVLLLLLLAGSLRFSDPGSVPYKIAQDDHFLNVDRILKTGKLPLTGTTNSWLNIGPLEYYLFLLPQWLDPRPEASVLFSALLGMLAMLIPWHFIRNHLSSDAALIFLALFACSPFAIHVSREVGNMTFQPLGTGLILSGILALARGRAAGICLSALGFSIAIQSHINSFPLLLVLPLQWLVYRKIFRFRHLVLAFILLVTPLSPYLLHEYQTGCSDILQRLEFSTFQRVVDTGFLRYFLNLGIHFDAIYYSRNKETLFSLPGVFHTGAQLLFLLLLLASLGFTALKVIAHISSATKTGAAIHTTPPEPSQTFDLRRESFLLFMLLGPFIFQFFVARVQAPVRYFVVFYPVYFIFPALLCSWILRRFSRSIIVWFSTGALIFYICISWTWTYTGALDRVRHGELLTQWIPLSLKKQIIETARRETGDDHCGLLTKIHFHNVIDCSGYRYLVEPEIHGIDDLTLTPHLLLLPKTDYQQLQPEGIPVLESGSLVMLSYKPVIRYSTMTSKRSRITSAGEDSPEPDRGVPYKRKFPLGDWGEAPRSMTFDFDIVPLTPIADFHLNVASRSRIAEVSLDGRTILSQKVPLEKIVRESDPENSMIRFGPLAPGTHHGRIRMIRVDLFDTVDIFEICKIEAVSPK